MKSGLDGRNNARVLVPGGALPQVGLNEVRPRRPEQFKFESRAALDKYLVSMKSGLEGRNNWLASEGRLD